MDRKQKALATVLAVAAVGGATILLIGQETAQAERDDYRRMYEEATSQPIPTVTKRVTSPPKTLPPKTLPPKTVEVTIRVTDRASRSSRGASDLKSRPTSQAPFKGWKADYWAKAQEWATWPKTRSVIMCESTDNPRAVSPSGIYRGLYQMDAAFWASYGGLELAPRPDLATRAEQNYVAYRGYIGNGWSRWSCA